MLRRCFRRLPAKHLSFPEVVDVKSTSMTSDVDMRFTPISIARPCSHWCRPRSMGTLGSQCVSFDTSVMF